MQPDIASDIGSEVEGRSREGTDRGAMLLAVSNAVVRIHKKYFGKGPTKARAYYDGDVLTCVLSDVYTRAEQTLLESGRSSAVLNHRHALQESVREEFVAEIEAITGREVVGFFSGNQVDPDLSVEVFVFTSNGQRSA
jgi:uncharacterized protein YbcI